MSNVVRWRFHMPEEPPTPDSAPPQATASQITKSAGVIGAATMGSRVLGLVRDQVLAFLFGAGDQMDAYNIAFRIPNLVRDLFAEGAMSAAFVPTFTRTLTVSGRAPAWRLGNLVVNALLLATGAIVILGIVFASPLSRLFASAYAEVPGKLELTIFLSRVMFPFLLLVAVAAALMGMLNSLHRFFVPAMSPAMFNVGSIVCTIGLAPVMPLVGMPIILAPAIGVLVGGLLQMAIQWPALRREGYRYEPILDVRDEGLRRVLTLMGPGVVGLAAVQINLLVNSILATGEGTGAVSALSYAFRVMYMPIGIFGVSIATAVVPTLSRHAARHDAAGMRETISAGLRLMLMMNVPATVGLMALATPIVALIFEHGRFTTSDTAATAAALACYAPGLVGYSAVKIAVPSFYAIHDSRTPVLVSVATVLLNIALNLALVHTMGFQGLALGTAISAVFNASILLWVLRSRLGGIDGRRIVSSFARIGVASLAMGAAAWATDAAIGSWMPERTIAVLALRVAASIGVALAVLDVAARACGAEEFREARALLFARLRPVRRTS
ncbi:MAG TPA: murein biosynthesis integral membrane protein MurJ [Vicinamibacterales bacterium]|nr:murein biosynthesis integral membrane protein MurJ [Vicinamibacterales bacterium]